MTSAPRRRTAAALVAAALSVALTVPLGLVSPASAAPSRAAAVPAAAVPSAAAAAVPAKLHRKLPRDSGEGRRIVYDRSKQHVWIVKANGTVIREFPVTGRSDWPRSGTYHVFSKSPTSYSPVYNVYWRYMVRFAHGNTASIGFHSIPTTSSGRPIQSVSSLGQPLGLGGCVRSADDNARFIYKWAGIGTKVVVL
ncbi:MAG: L,D-transpeptidase [Candidatus Nanopelagicales bacterium]